MWVSSTCTVNKSNSGSMKTVLVKSSGLGDFKGYKATTSSAFTLKFSWCQVLKISHTRPPFSNSTHPASYQTFTISLLNSILYTINREICLKCKFDLINCLLKFLHGIIIQSLTTQALLLSDELPHPPDNPSPFKLYLPTLHTSIGTCMLGLWNLHHLCKVFCYLHTFAAIIQNFSFFL